MSLLTWIGARESVRRGPKRLRELAGCDIDSPLLRSSSAPATATRLGAVACPRRPSWRHHERWRLARTSWLSELAPQLPRLISPRCCPWTAMLLMPSSSAWPSACPGLLLRYCDWNQLDWAPGRWLRQQRSRPLSPAGEPSGCWAAAAGVAEACLSLHRCSGINVALLGSRQSCLRGIGVLFAAAAADCSD